MIKVILISDVDKLGNTGEIKTVKEGYANNFLIPQKLALLANSVNMKLYEAQKTKIKQKAERLKKEFQEIGEKLSKLSITISREVGEEEKMFGAVTSQDISEAIKNEGIEIDKRKIELIEPLKTLGVHEVSIRLHPEVITQIKVWVVKT
jgi:large subunit ribosomal protein L9